MRRFLLIVRFNLSKRQRLNLAHPDRGSDNVRRNYTACLGNVDWYPSGLLQNLSCSKAPTTPSFSRSGIGPAAETSPFSINALSANTMFS